VQLCSARTSNPRRARFRALRLRYALGIDSAFLRSTSANCETNVFLLACKGQVDPQEYTSLGANLGAFGPVAARRSIWHLEQDATEATTEGTQVHDSS